MVKIMRRIKIGIVDTMFARVNMGAIAIDEIKKHYSNVEIVRSTVPGIKDIPPECKKLFQIGCDVCLALGMVGSAQVDKICAHEASLGIMAVKLETGKHIIEAFTHEDEGWNEREFYKICENRVRKHVHNAVQIVINPSYFTERAGKGIRQGKEDEGPIELEKFKKIKLGIVVSEFHKTLSNEMLEAAIEECKNFDCDTEIIKVPGTFEIPLAVKKLLEDKSIDGIVTLGYVEKGETFHDRVVAENASSKIMELSLQYNKPVTLGIITLANKEQAEKRKIDYAKRAVKAAVEMVKLLKR